MFLSLVLLIILLIMELVNFFKFLKIFFWSKIMMADTLKETSQILFIFNNTNKIMPAII